MKLNNEQQKTFFRDKAEALGATAEFEQHLVVFREQMDAAAAKGSTHTAAYMLALAYVVTEIEGAM